MKRLWLILLGVAAGLAGRRLLRPEALARLTTNIRDFDLPSAGLYEAVAGRLFAGLYRQIARELVAAYPSGRLLEIGSGPGQVAVSVARAAPQLELTGIDISADMVALANRRAEAAGIGGRLRFELGDVAALPYPDGSFDGIFATFSLHHWADPAGGLAEVYRVLRPGGEALLYEVPAWLWDLWCHSPGLAQLAAASPFGGGQLKQIAWPGSLRTVRRLRLCRAPVEARAAGAATAEPGS